MRHLRLWEKWWIVFVIPFARLRILPFQALLDAAGYCLVFNAYQYEYFLPSVVNDQLKAGTASVRVLPCEETWYGVTYREDLASVKDAIANMKKQGVYSDNLWN